MEQLIAGAKFPAKCVKNEIHNLLTTLRLTKHTSSGTQAQFHYEALRSFQRLFEELTYIQELHEFDTVAYLGPFLDVIQSDATDGSITAVALASVDKFVSFGLIKPDSPRCMEAVNTLAWGVINCRFVSSGSANDEVVLLKMVGLLIDCLRCPAGDYLSDMCVWHMVRKCFQISRQPRASHLLRASAEGVLQQMILTLFGTHKERARRITGKGGSAGSAITSTPPRAPPASAAAAVEPAAPLQVYRPYGYRAMHFVFRFLAFLLAYGRSMQGGADAAAKPRPRPRRQRSRSRSPGAEQSPRRANSRDASPSESSQPSSSDLGLSDSANADKKDLCIDSHCLGLSLLNIALESGGDDIARSDELISVIQDDICKSLLQNSRTESLSVLSLTLRAIFNLFLHFKKHLKVQLEVFFTSVHVKIAGDSASPYEQRELALESLLEFCREPELMLELYENYDCDVRCTNLFESLVKFLVSHAFPSDGAEGVKGGFNSLHRLALSGLLSILHSIALRCGDQGRKFCADRELTSGAQEMLPTTTTSAAETELQRKKEQKRRLTLAARSFNTSPKKCMSALQSLGLVSDPPTPESMAEFLRYTPGLDLPQVGEYLSNRNEFNGQVRKAFMQLFGFQGLQVVEGLRTCLSSFRLPGESQLIERLMESFAEAYYAAQVPVNESDDKLADGVNPLKVPRWVPCEKVLDDSADDRGDNGDAGGGPVDASRDQRVKLSSSDTIFVLSYSIIMLNTDLHNPGVKNRMKINEFIRNNRGIDNGQDLPAVFLTEVYEAIRDDEIRLHGDAAAEGSAVVDDFFWEGILRRSESIDEFSATERLLSQEMPGSTERDMFQVIMECAPLPVLSLCYESVPDVSVALQAMTGFQDLAKISFYFDQGDAVNSLVRVMCQYFARASAAGTLAVRAQIALRAGGQCVAQHAPLFREAEWRTVLDVLLQLWALDLLPPHLTEFDDFTGPDGKPLESLCKLRPPFTTPEPLSPSAKDRDLGPQRSGSFAEMSRGSLPEDGRPGGDGFLESLTRWFDDEIRDGEDDAEGLDPRRTNLLADMDSSYASKLATGAAAKEGSDAEAADGELPVFSPDPAVVHAQVKQYVARSGFVELFTLHTLSKLPPDSLQILAKGLVLLSRPRKWSTASAPATAPAQGGAASSGPAGYPVATPLASGGDGSPGGREAPSGRCEAAGAEWHEVADPVFGLELLTNMTCMPLTAGQTVSQIWPLVSTHFERLLQFVIAGCGSTEQQFIERLIVNTVRLCIRLIGNDELVATLLSLLQHLSKLPPSFFAPYSERIACGLLVFVKQTHLPHSGLSVVFALLRRISECQDSAGAGVASIEILNYWLNDDQELSRLLSQQQFHELLAALKAFAMQDSSPASATALDHLYSFVPQLARGARTLPCQWQALWAPTLSALSYVALLGPQKSSAQAFVCLQRLLLEQGTELSLPWEELPFSAWKECLEQVLFPMLQAQVPGEAPVPETPAPRQANAAQLLCRVVLTHLPAWQTASPDAFPALFLRLLHVLVNEATSETSLAREPLVQSLKNLLLVISTDPLFGQLSAPQHGMSLLEATWGVVSPVLPELRMEIALILDPSLADAPAAPVGS